MDKKIKTKGMNVIEGVGLQGRFGPFGGRYAPETLMHPLEELEAAYQIGRASCRERVYVLV